ncbi:MAG: hypothetical protein ACTSQE_09215 [Candidatus Heimdallarchaeaceae archaeon]
MRKSKTEQINELIGKARILAQQKQFFKAIELVDNSIVLLKNENDRKKLDLAKGLLYEYKAELAIKENKALEASNYLGRSGGFYMRLQMIQDLERVYKKQAEILLILSRQYMKDKRFIEAASYFEQAAMAFQKLKNKEMELDCKAKAYVSRAAAEKTIAGRKNYLKKATQLMEETGTNNPIIKGHLAYYNALFVQDEKEELALKYLSEAMQNYQLAGMRKRVEEIKKMIQNIMEKSKI